MSEVICKLQDCDSDAVMESIMSSMDSQDSAVMGVFTNTMEPPRSAKKSGMGFDPAGLAKGVQFDGLNQILSAAKNFANLFRRD